MPRRGSTTDRGYGTDHQAAKKQLNPTVFADGAWCAELVCLEELDGRTRWMPPGTESWQWHLAHDRRNPGHYLGPAHPRCNLSEGASHGNRTRGREETGQESARPHGVVASRDW